ncbi:spore germination protein GerPE [Peribacillus asahii]|uniref:spore germination protein GerPE n=1 Tax=Peribacillus asahii TaxID=228899 RepID=UPI00207A6B7F|nr:spore germination protein GerPE [Peribacillus asahii]USK71084.1 spore germination protein GerPE [Peribacillus asahii]
MFQRISKSRSLEATSIVFGSTLQIGDCSYIDGTVHALAVQRRSEILYERDDDFSDYKIFSRPLALPIITEPIQMRFNHLCPFIETGNIYINAISTSSVAGLGNVGHIRMKSKIHHTRQLSDTEMKNKPGSTKKEE